MTKGLFEALERVSTTIGGVIAADDFPETLSPTALADAVRDYPTRGGKRLRPALTLWSCGLLGGDPAVALRVAAAVEVYHNWTLTHDDIIDRDLTRRGRPTTHAALAAVGAADYGLTTDRAARFGVDFAILAGDLQQAWATDLMAKSVRDGVPADIAFALARDLQRGVGRELISGEALDVEFSYRNIAQVRAEEVERMLYLKTGALLAFCAEAGARVALRLPDGDDRTRRLGQFAARAGMAFQLRDDFLGLYGDEAHLGKPVGSDLRAAKPSILVLTALECLDASGRAALLRCLGDPSLGPKETARAGQLIRDCGAADVVQKKALTLRDEASAILGEFPDNPFRDLLSRMNAYFISRDR